MQQYTTVYLLFNFTVTIFCVPIPLLDKPVKNKMKVILPHAV